MNLDVRRPIFVVSGHWNPSIFNVVWLATNVFGKDVGQAVEIGQVIDGSRGGLEILFIEKVGFACLLNRLEIYTLDDSVEVLSRASDALKRVVELLCHTPMMGVGVNIHFSSKDIVPEVADALDTDEKLKRRFRIDASDFKTVIRYEDEVLLNYARSYGPGGTTAAFNFHAQVGDAGFDAAFIDRAADFRRISREFIEEVYGLTDFGLSVFEAQGEMDDER